MIEVRVTTTLPCGCEFSHQIKHVGVEANRETIEKVITDAADPLAYWHTRRAPRHRCYLVGPDNPNGLEPLTRPEPTVEP